VPSCDRVYGPDHAAFWGDLFVSFRLKTESEVGKTSHGTGGLQVKLSELENVNK